MHSYNYRSVKAISEYRYPQINKSRNRGQVIDVWPSQPIRRKQRANNRAPDRSRAA